MKIVQAFVFACVVAMPILTTHSWAQSSKKAVKVTDPNRVVRPDLGFSYITPEGYHPSNRLSSYGIKLFMEGERTTQVTTVYADQHQYVNRYLINGIEVFETPTSNEPATNDDFSSESAKKVVETIGSVLRKLGFTFNYQNSAKIQVAGHDALAILVLATPPGMNNQALLRMVLLKHRGNLYSFNFEADDTEFETRVPAFAAFMKSLKFLEPDVRPTPATPDPHPSAIKITLDH